MFKIAELKSSYAATSIFGGTTLPDDTDADVNLFTHFTAARIQTLMAAGTKFNNARAQAAHVYADAGNCAGRASLPQIAIDGSGNVLFV